jgi:hypothetical protein
MSAVHENTNTKIGDGLVRKGYRLPQCQQSNSFVPKDQSSWSHLEMIILENVPIVHEKVKV